MCFKYLYSSFSLPFKLIYAACFLPVSASPLSFGALPLSLHPAAPASRLWVLSLFQLLRTICYDGSWKSIPPQHVVRFFRCVAAGTQKFQDTGPRGLESETPAIDRKTTPTTPPLWGVCVYYFLFYFDICPVLCVPCSVSHT